MGKLRTRSTRCYGGRCLAKDGTMRVIALALALTSTGAPLPASAATCPPEASTHVEAARAAAALGSIDAAMQLASWTSSEEGCWYNPEEAWRMLQMAAASGRPRALYEIAQAYKFGKLGAARSPLLADSYMRQAAEGGHGFAQYMVGMKYSRGEGTPQNYSEAFRWFLKSAEHGDPNGQFEAGSAYLFGRGVPQNHTQARRWLERSSSQWGSNGMARILLGGMYLMGQGGAADPITAHKWLNIAAAFAENGSDEKKAAEALRFRLEATMTPKQVAAAQSAAAAFETRIDRSWLENDANR
jgi:TPR repeat protein